MENPFKRMKEVRDAMNQETPEKLEQQYKGDRATFLAIIVMTVVNILSVVFGKGTYFFFSAVIPYMLMSLAWGKGSWMVIGAFVISAAVLVVYFLCWLKSKEDRKWMKIGAILFTVDAVVLLGAFLFQWMDFVNDYDSLLYLIISGWAVWILLRSAFDLKAKR